MVSTIEELGVLNNTYFLVTSDHGYNLGQHRLPSCKLNVYDHDVRIPMVIKGPGITSGSKFSFPASNVDVGPTLLGLAGLDSEEYGMDGRSVAPLIVDASDPTVSESTSRHVKAHWGITGSAAESRAAWRDRHFIEYYSLGDVVRTEHLVDDHMSNTYRALRFMPGSKYGDFLYSEFTALADWNFQNVSFHEAFDVSTDPPCTRVCLHLVTKSVYGNNV